MHPSSDFTDMLRCLIYFPRFSRKLFGDTGWQSQTPDKLSAKLF